MLRRSNRQLVEHVTWTTKMRHKLLEVVRKNVPNPRDNPVTERPVSQAKHDSMYPEGMKIGPRPGEPIDEYMLNRDKKWIKEQSDTVNAMLKANNMDTPRHAGARAFAVPVPELCQWLRAGNRPQAVGAPVRA